jgi:hypothetical protein
VVFHLIPPAKYAIKKSKSFPREDTLLDMIERAGTRGAPQSRPTFAAIVTCWQHSATSQR